MKKSTNSKGNPWHGEDGKFISGPTGEGTESRQEFEERYEQTAPEGGTQSQHTQQIKKYFKALGATVEEYSNGEVRVYFPYTLQRWKGAPTECVSEELRFGKDDFSSKDSFAKALSEKSKNAMDYCKSPTVRERLQCACGYFSAQRPPALGENEPFSPGTYMYKGDKISMCSLNKFGGYHIACEGCSLGIDYNPPTDANGKPSYYITGEEDDPNVIRKIYRDLDTAIQYIKEKENSKA